MPSETEDHMTEILTELWGLPEAEPFHHEADKDTLPDCPPKCLRQIGERLDSSSYATLADFAEDLRDVLKSLKGYYDVSGGSPDMFKKEQASSCLSTFEKMLVDITGTKAAKKRPRASPSSTTPKAAPSAPNSAKSSRAPTSAPLSREQKLEQGLNLLCDYIVDCGGGRDLLDGWYTSIELRKDGKTQGTTDMYYFSATGKKFRSRAEVARHFRLAAAPPKRQAGAKKKMLTYSTERKRVEREINKLSANRVKAEAKLTELGEDQVKSTYPIDDDLLVQRGEAAPQTLPVPGGEGLPGIPADSLTDLFAVWDFLTTFDKTLLLSVTTLEDFATAITCDAGVFLAEAHVGMMRLLLSDEANDDWWKREPLPGDPAPPPAADPVPPPAAPEEKKEDDDSSEDESEDEKSDDEEDKMDIVEDDTPKSRTIAELLLSTCEKPSSLAILPVNFPLYAGIVCERVLDMYAKRRIAADNEIRDSKGLPLLTREEVQSRRASTAVRLFPPCSDGSDNDVNPLDGAIAALSRGDEYTSLNAAQKILILRLLVEALYETDRVRNVVEDNTNSRANAEKKLEDETRQQARGEREAWQAIQARAKEEMYSRQKEEFLEEQRKEMRADDPENEMLDWSNDQLLEDEAISAQCEASLAAPTKNEILEAAQLLKKKTDLGEGEVRIVTLDELSEIDSEALRKLEEEASSTVYDVDDLDSSEARETLGRQDISALKDLKYRRDQARLKVEEYAPARVAYVDMLEEAVATDDIKMLRNAIKAARIYDLQGRTSTHESYIEESLINAVVALKAAEGRRKKNEAKKNLVQQRDACFVRTEPLGVDREGKRYWAFGGDHPNRLWIETLFGEGGVGGGEKTMEEVDIVDRNWGKEETDGFLDFSVQEYPKRSKWCSYVTEKSCRDIVKQLDERGVREKALKEALKEFIDNRARPDEGSGGDEGDLEWKLDGDLLGAVGKRVRHKFSDGCYLMGTVVGWVPDGIVDDREGVALWHVAYDAGEEEDWEKSLVEAGLAAAKKYLDGGFVDADGGVYGYRNQAGRYWTTQGLKVGDASKACSVFALATLLVKREAEMFPGMKEKAKRNTWEDEWNGKDGLRAHWVAALKDALRGDDEEPVQLGFVKQSLLNLEESMLNICTGVEGGAAGDSELMSQEKMEEEYALNAEGVHTYVYADDWGTPVTAETLWPSGEGRRIWKSVIANTDSVAVVCACMDVLATNARNCSSVSKGVTRGQY